MTEIVSPLRSDLRRILLAVPGLPPTIKWEGRKPSGGVVGVARLDEKLEMVASRTDTFGSYGMQRDEFVYHLNLYYPTTAQSDMETFADKLRRTFFPGRAVGRDGVVGVVTAARWLRLVENDANLELPVRIALYVRYLTRPLG